MRALLYLGLLAAVVAATFWLTQRAQDSRRRVPPPPPPLAASSTGPSADTSARARLLYGAEAGPGRLLLTSSQLIFNADSGRVWVVERIDISGASTTRDLPDRSIARPALVVTTTQDAHYFEVDDPAAWVARLL